MPVLKPGQKVGKYEVKRLIKENRYCETYRVEDDAEVPYFLKLYILKDTPQHLLDEQQQVRSISIAAELRNELIVSFVEQGHLHNEEVGQCQYIVTVYYGGELLADKLQREGKLEAEEAFGIFGCILDALKYLHGQSYFHNDLTVRNVILLNGIPRLIDLGHVSSFVAGRPPFDTSDLDERYQSNTTFAGMYSGMTDIFSAIAIYYTMLTGRVPWDVAFPEGADRKQRIKIVKEARKKEIDLEGIEVTDVMKRILQKGLLVNGTSKYADVEELQSEINGDYRMETHNGPQSSGAVASSWSKTSGDQKETEAKVEMQKGKGHGFSDIAGMTELKNMLNQKVIFILKDKEKAERYKLTPPNGMLLYGPPGCGKSFFAEKFAEETGFNFVLVKASDLGSIYVHGSQGMIADLFKKAEQNSPTVICFDEFDAFVPNRSQKGAEHQAGEVNEFLTQLNNCSKRGIFVIATSNRPDMIDPAVLRTGRIDKMVYVPMPDKEARREMFKLHLNGRPCTEIDAEKLADMTEGYIASDIAYIVNDAAMGAAFSDQPISQQMLEQTIQSIRPSISKEVADSYEDLRAKMENVDRRNQRPKIGFV